MVASIRHGALGERDFASVASRAERRLAFYAERCGALVSLDLSYWRTVRASVRLQSSLSSEASLSLSWLA